MLFFFTCRNDLIQIALRLWLPLTAVPEVENFAQVTLGQIKVSIVNLPDSVLPQSFFFAPKLPNALIFHRRGNSRKSLLNGGVQRTLQPGNGLKQVLCSR